MHPLKAVLYFILCLCAATVATAQNANLVSKELLPLSPRILHKIDSLDPELAHALTSIDLFRITYMSDGLHVVGFLAVPRAKGSYPCIIANRGGRWDFSLWKPFTVAFYLGRMASWGYIVIASQYRGSIDGSEGKDEYGGRDINDVFNTIPILEQIDGADTSRIGLYGESRGGMMALLAMKRSCRFRAAALVAPMSDAFDVARRRPEIEEKAFHPLIPGYNKNKDQALRARSAIYWADSLCHKTPLLIMHGTADSSVNVQQSRHLVDRLNAVQHPVTLIVYPGADHLLSQFESEMLTQCRRLFDDYVRDRKRPSNKRSQ